MQAVFPAADMEASAEEVGERAGDMAAMLAQQAGKVASGAALAMRFLADDSCRWEWGYSGYT